MTSTAHSRDPTPWLTGFAASLNIMGTRRAGGSFATGIFLVRWQPLAADVDEKVGGPIDHRGNIGRAEGKPRLGASFGEDDLYPQRAFRLSAPVGRDSGPDSIP